MSFTENIVQKPGVAMSSKTFTVSSAFKQLPGVKLTFLHTLSTALVLFLSVNSQGAFKVHDFSVSSRQLDVLFSDSTVLFVLIGLMVLLKRRSTGFDMLRVMKFYCIPTIISVLYLGVDSIPFHNDALELIALSIIGLSYVPAMIVLFENFSKLKLTSIVAIFILTITVALFVFPFYYNMNDLVSFIVFLLISPITFLSLKYTQMVSGGEIRFSLSTAKEKSETQFPTIFIVTFVLIGTAASAGDQYRTIIAPDNLVLAPLLLSFIFMLAVMIYFCKNPDFNFNRLLYTAIIPLLCFALTVANMRLEEVNYVSLFCQNSADMLTWVGFVVIIQYLSRYTTYNLRWITYCGLAAITAGNTIGWAIFTFAVSYTTPEHYFSQAVPFICFGTLVTSIFLFNKKNMRDGWGWSTISSGEYTTSKHEKSCKIISTQYKLTERESEVLTWIGKGYSNAKIADTLHLAPSTIKMHAGNLYRKLGIHSKQAVIDIINETKNTL